KQGGRASAAGRPHHGEVWPPPLRPGPGGPRAAPVGHRRLPLRIRPGDTSVRGRRAGRWSVEHAREGTEALAAGATECPAGLGCRKSIRTQRRSSKTGYDQPPSMLLCVLYACLRHLIDLALAPHRDRAADLSNNEPLSRSCSCSTSTL